MRYQTIIYILISLAITVFIVTSLSFNFYQDDAYISYRYVANYLNGDGLVFNIGERVEGYTNFGWVLYLLLCGVIGLKYIAISKLTGVFLGAATIFVTFLIAEACLGKKAVWFSLIAVMLIAFNPSLAYWSQAGLETAAFVFLAALGLYLFLLRHRLLIAVLVLAVLVRPEGALLAGLFIVIEWFIWRRWPLFSLGCAGIALLFSLPFVGFKLIYYGSILPNPFFAKTGFDLQQLQAGLDYAGRFFGHYAFFAVGLIVLPFLWRRIDRRAKAVWIFSIIYLTYIVLVGGDVLKVHRFFLPILVPMAILIAILLHSLTVKLIWPIKGLLVVLVTTVLVIASVWIPRDFIYRYEVLEERLTHKMAFLADRLKETDKTDFIVASATIGQLGYRLVGHRVIDLLGLTDSTIARHPQPPLTGMESTWRERVYNTPYVLEAAPDYIVFSTGAKPSAPAERALMTYRQFLDCYRGVVWFYQPPGPPLKNPLLPIFRKVCSPAPAYVSSHSIDFVNWYNRGLNAGNAANYARADSCFQKALEYDDNPPYVYLLFRMGLNYDRLGQPELCKQLLDSALGIDSAITGVHASLYAYEFAIGNQDKAAIHRHWLEELSPWLLPYFDSIAFSSR